MQKCATRALNAIDTYDFNSAHETATNTLKAFSHADHLSCFLFEFFFYMKTLTFLM